jgi:hypothetical protein
MIVGWPGIKDIYLKTSSGNNMMVTLYERTIAYGGDGISREFNNSRFTDIFPGGESDESWHCYEVHFKAETTSGGSDGVCELWIDGVQKTPKGWTQGTIRYGARAAGGWTGFEFPGNAEVRFNSSDTEGWVDIDDIAISAVGYIGPIGNVPKAPTGLKIVQ